GVDRSSGGLFLGVLLDENWMKIIEIRPAVGCDRNALVYPIRHMPRTPPGAGRIRYHAQFFKK
ncbi:MAG: hypothetical protein WDZ60_03515, partial [Wenzhouxiangellaceae bacterium]